MGQHKKIIASGVCMKNLKLVFSLFLFCLLFSPHSAQAADSVITDVNVAVPISCSMFGTGMNSHNATIPNGTGQEGIGTTTLKAFCNDSNGFSIYAIGYTDSTDGKNVLVGNAISSDYDIATGLSMGGANSQWAMRLNTNTSATYPISIENSYNAYQAVPSSYTLVATSAAKTDVGADAVGASLTTTYRAYISPNQPSGNYNGKVKYVMVHPASNVPNEARTCAANKICYWPNGGDMTVGGVGVVDSMGDQTLSATTTLWASNFKRAGYGFVGWSDKYDWELNANDASGNGTGANAGYHIYGPNQTLTLNTSDYSSTNGGLSLYAVWAPSAGTIQGWTGCSSLGSGKVTALTDTRDNNTYAVAKLADGNCWMIENLRLDYDANITTSNTQNNNNAFGGVFSGLAQPETANFSDSTTANTLYKSDGSGDIVGVNGATLSDIGNTSSTYPGYRMPRYRNDNTNTNSTINPNVNTNNMTSTGQNIYSYGNYYTWAAAMANTNHYYTTTTDANGFTPSEAVGTSLCPTGWKLPYGRSSGKGATSGGFSYLDIQLGGTGADSSSSTTPTGADMSKIYRSYPNNFLYSGYTNNSSVNGRGSNGLYWSSTASNSYNSYTLTLSDTNVCPGTNNSNKNYGYSIRCLVGS